MEKGGLNLYGFVTNNPINRWDYLGMEPGMPPSYVGETVDVLEDAILADGKPGQKYVTYRAVRLADMNNQENGSADNDLIWVRDDSGNRDGPTRGMPESSGGFGTGPLGMPLATINFGAIIAAVTPKPSTPAARVLTLNFGFEEGADRNVIQGYVNAFQSVVDKYVRNNQGAAAITITFNAQEKDISSPSDGVWSTNKESVAALTSIKGDGPFNVLIASSRITGNLAGLSYEESSFIGIRIRRGAGFVGPNAGVLTLAHEVGHMMGYRGNAPGQHDGEEMNVMHNPGPPEEFLRFAFIDKQYYDLLVKFSSPVK